MVTGDPGPFRFEKCGWSTLVLNETIRRGGVKHIFRAGKAWHLLEN